MGLAVASVGGGILWAAIADRSVDDVLDTLPLSADDRATLRDDLATSDLADAARATARRKVAAELGEDTKQGVSRASRAGRLHRS